MEDGATDDFGLPSRKIHNHSEHHSGRNAWAWVVLWLAPLFATVGPSDDPAVARMKHTYGDVLRTRHTVHEISKVIAENRFVLNRPPGVLDSSRSLRSDDLPSREPQCATTQNTFLA